MYIGHIQIKDTKYINIKQERLSLILSYVTKIFYKNVILYQTFRKCKSLHV